MGSVKNIRKINVTVERAFAAHNYTHHQDGYDPIDVGQLGSSVDSGVALYADGSGGLLWKTPETGGITSLSGLIVDTDKDWNGYNITNFGTSSYDVEDELDSIITTIGDMGGITNVEAIKIGESFPAGHTKDRLFFRPDDGIFYDDGSDWSHVSFVNHDDMDIDAFNHHHPERDSGTDVHVTPYIEYSGSLDAQPIMAISLEPNEKLQLWRLGFERIDGTYDNVSVDVYDDTNDQILYSVSDGATSSIGTLPPLATSEYGVDIKLRLHTNESSPVTVSVNYGFKLTG